MSKREIRKLLASTTDKRQLRLFAVACCRNIWHLLTDPRSRNAVEVAEQFADGLVNEEELNSAKDVAWNAVSYTVSYTASYAVSYAASVAAWSVENAANYARDAANAAAWAARDGARKQQLAFLKDIIAQPSIELNPNLLYWNNSLLPKFATNIYTNKDFSLMPILADALEEANAPIVFIEHCREKVHVKGCWLLDVLMGKREKLTRSNYVKT